MSQAVIGYTPPQLREKFPNVSWEYGKWGPEGDKTMMMMIWRSDEMVVNYFFNKNNVTESCTIVPLTQGILQGMVEKYNNRYVIVDKQTWRFYNDGTIFLCKLKALDTGVFYFWWTEE
jgi:hypothetical protein